MPFVDKSRSSVSQSLVHAGKNFIGRANELAMFRQEVLQAEKPLHNILSVYGNGGVGKSTLLTKFNDLASMPGFKEYCITAFVDEHQATLPSIMKKFAEQLHITGEFAKAVERYEDALRKLQLEREASREDVWSKAATGVISAAVKGVPVVGGALEQGTGLAVEYLFNELKYRQLFEDAKRLEDPIRDLTKAFVRELNALAETQVIFSVDRTRRNRRVILFFDTFEQLAPVVAPWLLDYFLEEDINANIVLVIAGRMPLENSIPVDPKRWIPYHANDIIRSISLESFTRKETEEYLHLWGITDPAQVETIWQLSRGLPLYLALLTFNPQGTLDPTASVVANFLRWIPEQEQVKRRLALDASLFTKSINQDDLEVCAYIPEEEREAHFQWLISLPFVRTDSAGRYIYHDLAQELFSRHLYQRSPKEYYATRSNLLAYYKRAFEKEEQGREESAYGSAVWKELIFAIIQQLFFLQEKESHVAAIQYTLTALKYLKRSEESEIVKTLQNLLSDSHRNLISSASARTIRELLPFIEFDLQNLSLIASVNYLLEVVTTSSLSFPPAILAMLYRSRARVYAERKEYERAKADFARTIELAPAEASTYLYRGMMYSSLDEDKLVIADMSEAIKHCGKSLEKELLQVVAYIFRGLSYWHLSDFQQAGDDFERVVSLEEAMRKVLGQSSEDAERFVKTAHFMKDMAQVVLCELAGDYEQAIPLLGQLLDYDPQFDQVVYSARSEIYQKQGRYKLALADLNQLLALNPRSAQAFNTRGQIYVSLGEYEKALADAEQALTLDPSLAWVYKERGEIYQQREEYEKALADFEQLVALAPQSAESYGLRGEAHRVRGELAQALADFNQALTLAPHYAFASGSRGQVYQQQGEEEKALADFEQALALDSRLAWVYKERGRLYQQRGEYEKALADFEQLVALAPQSAESYSLRGEVHRLRGEFEQALADFNQALTLVPHYAWALAQREQIYFTLREYEKALADAEQLVILLPQSAEAYGLRGEAHRMRGELEQALADFNQALALDPHYAWAFSRRGEIHRLCGDFEQALDDFNQTLTLDPRNTFAFGLRGEAYRMRGELEQALADFNQALTLVPHYAWVLAQREQIYFT